MKKYLTVSYAYPVYFLLILGQYFLAEGLDRWYNAPARVPSVAQPAENPPGVPAAARGKAREGNAALPAGE
jgi:hypothetical protein